MGKGYILGYDINDLYGQISFYNFEDEEPETVSAGTNNYQIPLILAFFNDRWVYGKEAKRLEIINEGVAFTDFFSKARKREKIEVGGKSYDAVWLLAKFIQLSLEQFDKIEYITFSVPSADVDMYNLLKGLGQHLGITKSNIAVQDYQESFCHFMYDQPKELWQYEAALFSCNKEDMKAYMLRRLSSRKRDDPNLYVTVEEVAGATIEELSAIFPVMDDNRVRDADEKFKAFIQGVFEKKVVSSVFLTGEGFENEWFPNSLRVLCNGRRAFVGNNLYSKGACYYSYKMMFEEQMVPIYLDHTSLLTRLCLRIRERGKEIWHPLVNWGRHWYEADNEWEVILEDTQDLEVRVESLVGGEVRIEKISLEGLPVRKDYSLRVLIDVMFFDDRTCKVTVKDIGFGEFFESSGFKVEKLIDLGGSSGQFNSMS